MLATKLGIALGLPMLALGGLKIPCRSGRQLGSLYVGCESPGMTFDYLPRQLLQRVVNVGDFARVLVLDKWTCNSDGRQAIFWRKTLRSHRHHATFIDQGYCFNASEWTFPDYPLRGVYANNCVYEAVTGWESFEPALTSAEEIESETIWRCAAEIPEEWYEGDRDGLHRLVEALHHRRWAIRKLITEFRRYRQAGRVLLPKLNDVRGRPLTPLHGGHVGLLCTAGMLNGVFGDGETRHIVHWRSVKFTDHWEEEEEDGTKILYDRERFSHQLTLVFANGKTQILTHEKKESE
jgi:hypothetical protein